MEVHEVHCLGMGTRMTRRWWARAAAGVALTAVVALVGAATAEAQGAIGLIYMNGKQAPTNTVGSNDIASKGASAGIKVVVPSMPWGQGAWEKISVTPDQVFGMIDGYASQLRAQGAQRIGEDAVLMDSRLVREGVFADDGLVGRALEADDLAEHF